MRNILVLILLGATQVSLSAQAAINSECANAKEYRLNSQGTYAELEIKLHDKWQSFQLLDDVIERFEYHCEEAELNDTGSKELIIKWSNAVYGTGGGSTTKGIQIWNLDKGSRLLDEITSCSQENFGRGEAKAYLGEYYKEVEIVDREIRVHEKKCQTEWSEKESLPDPTSSCSLTTLKEGVYVFRNGTLKKK